MKIVSMGIKAASAIVTEGQATIEPEMNLANGNTNLAKETQSWARTGYTKRTQSTIKRIYYTAGLRPELLTNISFTDEFKYAALGLGNSTYDFDATIGFIHNWGNYGASFDDIFGIYNLHSDSYFHTLILLN